jgi:plasmid stability protein
MPDILVKGFSDETVKRLKAMAKRNGRSFQAELRALLENATQPPIEEVLKDARAFRKKLGRRFDDSTALIREDRDR